MVDDDSYLVSIFATKMTQVIRVPNHTAHRLFHPKEFGVISEVNPFDWVMLASGAGEHCYLFRSKEQFKFFNKKK